MGRTDNWGEEPLKRAKHLIKFLMSYDNHERGSLFVEWRKEGTDRPELFIRTALLDLAQLINRDQINSRNDLRAKKEKTELQNTIDRLKELSVVTENSTPGEKSKGIRQLIFILWHTRNEQENLRQLQLVWSNRSLPKKDHFILPSSTALEEKPDISEKKISSQLKKTLELYLDSCFRTNKFAKLDQAGEKDEDDTKLVKVFIDLDAKLRQGIQPSNLKLKNFPAAVKRALSYRRTLSNDQLDLIDAEGSFSVMDCLLKEYHHRILIIGGPGQGKSTLGQQLAQIHRAAILPESWDNKYQPQVKRYPFHVVLREFAQWLGSESEALGLEAYLADQVGKKSKRPGDITARDIQDILSCHPCLLILDGLDEVYVPKLQRRMLDSVEEFLGAAERLNSDLMVIATSRPSGYDHQFFEPERFLTLELDLLKNDKVTKYVEQWLDAKELGEEKNTEILTLLKDCQNDPSISQLLVTPLQVSIILIIIKNGRRPPSERESLFNEYWSTIFRREEAKNNKINAIIQNQESYLLLLHAYLGYLLHREATDENVQSLLSTNDFKQAIYKFLKARNQRLKEDEITPKIDQLIKEVGDRLYMILQQQTGQYGFGLRSFQEFFAAVHLVQTANETKQRFNRLKAILRFEHWTNVALFMAGRLARTYTGEADRLQSTWRAVDRDRSNPSNRYLRPGAWFALQIAADGSLGDTDLQASAVEDSLKVLETGLSSKQQSLFKSLVTRLSRRDQQEILEPALKDKMRTLPESCLLHTLSIYSHCFGTTPIFLKKIDVLLESKRENLIIGALGLIFERKPDLQWAVERFQRYWAYSKRRLIVLWFTSSEDKKYLQRILDTSLLSVELILELAEELLERGPYYHSSSDRKPTLLISEPSSASEQLLLALICTDWISYYDRKLRRDETRVAKFGVILLAKEEQRSNLPDISKVSIETIKNILRKPDLIPSLRLYLWKILWYIEKPTVEMVSIFLQDIWIIEQQKEQFKSFFKYVDFTPIYPLLSLAVNKQFVDGRSSIQNLIPFLCEDNQSSIIHQIKKAIQNYIKQANQVQARQFVTSLRSGVGLDKLFPDLKVIAEPLGITIKEILNAYSVTYRQDSRLLEEDSNYLEQLLIEVEICLIKDKHNGYQIDEVLRFINSEISWSPSREILDRVVRLLELIWSEYLYLPEKSFSNSMLALFLKLLACDKISQQFFQRMLNVISKEEIIEFRPWHLREVTQEAFARCLDALKLLMLTENEDIKNKAALLLSRVADAPDRYGSISRKLMLELKKLHLSAVIGLKFLESEDIETRISGITLLTWSDYHIEDINCRNRLLNELQQVTIAREERAWSDFLQKIPMDGRESILSSFLEEILSEPKNYGDLVLSAAMERYQRVSSASNVTISEEQEMLLGLP